MHFMQMYEMHVLFQRMITNGDRELTMSRRRYWFFK